MGILYWIYLLDTVSPMTVGTNDAPSATKTSHSSYLAMDTTPSRHLLFYSFKPYFSVTGYKLSAHK